MITLNVTLLIQMVIFLAFVVLLDRLLLKPMVRVLEERRERTEVRRTKAAQVDAEAESILAEYQKKIQQARSDADGAREQLVWQGEVERQKLVEAATAQAEMTVSEIRARVRAEAQEARKALETEVQTLAGSVAQKILGRAV